MHAIFRNMLSEEIYEPIVCSCWRLDCREHINLYALMRDFGFKLKQEGYKNYVCTTEMPEPCIKTECPFCTGSICSCQEDLYIRETK